MNKLLEKLRYQFDRFLAKGSIALVVSLFVVMFIIVILISIVLYIVNPNQNLGTLIWTSFMQTLDAGNLSGENGSIFYMIMMTIATVVGIFITSLFISFILNGFQMRLESLSRGRSKVIETNHTLILGYDPTIFVVIKELIEANRSIRKPVIVILCDKDSVEANQEIKDNVPNFYNTKVICRTGSIYNKNDLAMCSIEKAKSIILIENDMNSIKSLLAISDTDFFKINQGHVSMIMNDMANISVAKSIGKDKVEVIFLNSAITRIIAQSSLQNGLAQVYNDLLDFDGDEIYFYQNKNLIGYRFDELILKFPKATVIGIVKNGKTIVKPVFDTVYDIGDEIIVIAEDEDKIEYDNHTPYINKDLISMNDRVSSIKIEQISIIGYNQKTSDVIKEYDNYLEKGSIIRILVNSENCIHKINQLNDTLNNIEIQTVVGETYLRPVLGNFLDALCKKVIIFANDNIPFEDKDSQTLLTLLHLREMEEIRGTNLDIISEIADVRNVDVIDLAKSDDFIISELLASKMLTQVSENRMLLPVFEDLMDADGSEIYIKNLDNYLKQPAVVDFYTISQAATIKNEIAIGYIRCHGGHSQEVVLNPNKSNMIDFKIGDKIIVISED